MSLAILRKHVADVEVRKPQDVSQFLFVLVAIQAAHRSAAVLCHVGKIGLVQQRRELPHIAVRSAAASSTPFGGISPFSMRS